MVMWVLLAGVLGCGAPDVPASEPATVQPRAGSVVPDPSGNSWPVVPMSERQLPDGVTADWLKQACDVSSCQGRLSNAIVFRDAEEHATLLYVLGDLTRCSHAGAVYVDRSGTRIGAISGHPLPDGVSFESLHAPYRAELTEAETIDDICAGH